MQPAGNRMLFFSSPFQGADVHCKPKLIMSTNRKFAFLVDMSVGRDLLLAQDLL
jgi:hypothetical protein